MGELSGPDNVDTQPLEDAVAKVEDRLRLNSLKKSSDRLLSACLMYTSFLSWKQIGG